ncbi:MAG: HPP family protein [Betaproteobacteria bacterium]|nr:HPP family protein [Betaproteobacteria bacterium]MDE2477484.1 HPP family protein [Betaproteobacteria bacterium]
MRSWWRSFVPAATAVDGRERLRMAVGGALGIAVTGFVAHALRPWLGPVSPWLVAPLGASAVLVFCAPSSPMAQPWPVIGGDTLSALVAVLCVRWLGHSELVAAVAVGAAIAVMVALRCLHPPGGASALLSVLAGVGDPHFVLFPVLVDTLLLVAVGLLFNNATGRSYPHRPIEVSRAAYDPSSLDQLGTELDRLLARYNQVFDIAREDLLALLEDTHLQSYRRRLDDLRCADVMSPDPIAARPGMPPGEAAALLQRHRVKALPVVDGERRLVGIVTPADLARGGATVGELMTPDPRVAGESTSLAALIPLFAGTGHHHLPVVAPGRRLVGMMTESNLVAALARAGGAS